MVANMILSNVIAIDDSLILPPFLIISKFYFLSLFN